MVTVIDSEEYNEMVALQAEVLATEAYQKAFDADEGGFEQGVIELAHDVIDGHEWFVQRRYGPAAHGSVIEHAETNGVDPRRYGDMVNLGEEDDLDDAVRTAAYYAFEADVIKHAKEIGPEGVAD